MSDEQPGFLDWLVEVGTRGLDRLGFNGRRLRWKWEQYRRSISETGMKTEMLRRSTQGKHKMCPSCRALVPKSAGSCTECGATLVGVRAPGVGRTVSNLLPQRGAATSLIVLVNGLFFVLLLMAPTPGDAMQSSLMRFSGYNLYRFGGGSGALVLADGEWWRMVTSIFLHGGLLHFGFNTYVLMQLGPMVEELYGSAKFWVVYLGAGIAGNVAAQFVNPGSLVVGASGADVGLIGLLLAYGMRRGGVGGQAIKNSMMRWAFYILVFSLLPGISLLSHAGGFVGGLLLGLAIPTQAPGRSGDGGAWQTAAIVGLMVVLLAFWQVSIHGEDFARHMGT